MIYSIFKLSLFCLLFLSVVVPNSLRAANAALLIFCFVLSLCLCRPLKSIPRLMTAYLATVVITVIFVLVGQINAAPREAAEQVLIIYIVSPLCWLWISCAMALKIEEVKIAKWFVRLGILSVASVGVYFYLFLQGGPAAVSFFIEDANLNLQDGYAGATMFVYGSLIFLTAGFFAASSLIKNALIRAALLAGLAIVAITSGRSALILAVPIGLFMGTFFSPSGSAEGPRRSRASRAIRSPIFYFFVSSALCLIAAPYFGVDVGLILSKFAEEVNSGGGGERTSQLAALFNGTLETFGMGAGHGIGVSLLRSEAFPWRYENVWAATVFRTGVVGALIYAAPFIYYIRTYFFLKKREILGKFDLFMFSGFCAAFFASMTNPYIEAFSFQWMFIIPMVSLAVKRTAYKRDTARSNQEDIAEGSDFRYAV